MFATLVLLFVVAVQTYTLFDKTLSTYYSNLETLRAAVTRWPFFAVAWLGDVSAVMLIAVRTYRLVFHPELDGPARRTGQGGGMRPRDERRLVALVGFIALFVLMLLRVPVGMAMGLVGVLVSAT